jgi:hypothetical protein
MTADFSYITGKDGFTSVMPNTSQAEVQYNTIFADGGYRLMPHEFKAFRSQARQAGYSVRKAESKIDLDTIIDVDLLLGDLEA